jgi:hypothetical protein
MAEGQGVNFTPRTARRLIALLRRFEGFPLDNVGQRLRGPQRQTIVQRMKVTAVDAGEAPVVWAKFYNGTDARDPEVPVAAVRTLAVDDELFAFWPKGGTGETYLDDEDEEQPVHWQELAGSGGVMHGKLAAAWTPGTNQVTLTPCVGPLDDTETGADDVEVYIQYPLDLPAVALAADAGQVLGYSEIAPGVLMLHNPPQLPRATQQYQVVENASAVAGSPNWVAAHKRANA